MIICKCNTHQSFGKIGCIVNRTFFICSEDEVEAKLENEGGQIYSPVRDHPFFQKQQQQQIQHQQQQKQLREQQEQQEQEEEEKKTQHQSRDTIPKQHPPKPPRKQTSVPRQPSSATNTAQYQHMSSASATGTVDRNAQSDSGSTVSAPPMIRLPQQKQTIMKECDIEKFAQDNLNLHSKGIFRKKSSIRDMLSWTAETISRPMLALSRDKAGKKMATEMFKLVQIYMGDRKARDGMSLNSVAIDIITTGLTQVPLRDELYIQLCRQTTENHKRESLIRGWELFAICLSFLPPSPTFQPALLK